MSSKSKALHWYAIEYAYGPQVINNGNRADTVREFATKAERDKWVKQGSPQRGPGWRQAIRADGWQARQYRKQQGAR